MAGRVPPATPGAATDAAVLDGEVVRGALELRKIRNENNELKQRIEQLEQERAASAAPGQAGAYDSHTGSSPAAVASPRTVYGAPAGGQTTPAPSRSMGGHAGAADRQASPVQGAVQPGVQQSPTSVDWRPSGYYHPAMQ